ncbi:MAG: hypothetical protein ACXACG_06705 [Candidatus Thorarchaeota archaeon]|jgi:hypothetical protein
MENEQELEKDWSKLTIIPRLGSVIIGLLILYEHVSLYQAAVQSYSGWVNFWYYTDNTMINLLVAIWIIFVVVGLVLYPIYPPKTIPGALLGYLGCAMISIGYGLTVNLSAWSRSNVPDTALVGYGILFVGLIITGMGYRVST